MITNFKDYGLIALAVMCIALSGTCWYMLGKIEDLNKEVAVLEEANVALGTAVEEQAAQANKNYALYMEQAHSNSILRAESTAKSREITKYKGREHVVYAKPGLVERLEQKALDEFFKGVEDGQR
ncbi:Rz-like spanin [Vibrio phage D239]